MLDIMAKLFSFAFIIIIYMFIIKIIQMVYLDIDTMSRKKSSDETTGTYLKLINLRRMLDFYVSESYPISRDVCIGRDSKCGISIDDPFMSQRHAEIIVRDGVCYISDMGSTNGTFINGNELSGEPLELLNGDKLQVGQLSFIFVTDSGEEGVGVE